MPSQVKATEQKRAQAFAHMDEAKLGWFHLRAVIVSGVGFFADAYDVFVISQALPMIYQVYYGPMYISGNYPANMSGINNPDPIPKTPQNTKVDFYGNYPGGGQYMDGWLKASTNWGNLFGQIGFGILSDKLGRKRMYGIELIIMIICTFASALCGPMSQNPNGGGYQGISIIVILSIWRFFLGVGIGGDYPMSATITSEFANVRHRGMMLAAVFAMQGLGIMVGSLAYIAVLAAFKTQIQNDFRFLDAVWRICIGFGIVPALSAVYFRLTIPESPRYTVNVVGDTDKAETDAERIMALNNVANISSTYDNEEHATPKVQVKGNSFADFRSHFGQWKYGKVLLGTAYCWFALDVAWYGLALNASTVLNLINFNGAAPKTHAWNATLGAYNNASMTAPSDVFHYFYENALGNLIIVMAGTVPGYWVSVGLIEVIGRKPIQYMGFAVIGSCLAVLSATWNTISAQQIPFLVIYTIAQFFFQFGPNTTTFVYPGEVFPTRFRSTAHGLSAAAGKVGAIIGIQAVGPFFASNAQSVMAAFSVVMFSGMVATSLLPEPKGKTLEELSGEDEELYV